MFFHALAHTQATNCEAVYSWPVEALVSTAGAKEKHRKTGLRPIPCRSKVTGAFKPVECRVLFIEILECGQRRGFTFCAQSLFLFSPFIFRRCRNSDTLSAAFCCCCWELHQTPGEGRGSGVSWPTRLLNSNDRTAPRRCFWHFSNSWLQLLL